MFFMVSRLFFAFSEAGSRLSGPILLGAFENPCPLLAATTEPADFLGSLEEFGRRSVLTFDLGLVNSSLAASDFSGTLNSESFFSANQHIESHMNERCSSKAYLYQCGDP